MEWYEIFGVVYGIGIIYLVYEARNAPLMPDDYDLSDEEKGIMKDIESRNDEGHIGNS